MLKVSRFFYFFLFLALSLESFAYDKNIVRINVTPNQQELGIWMNDFFHSKDFLIIKDKQSFFDKLRTNHPTHTATINSMEELIFTLALRDEIGNIASFYGRAYNPDGGFLVLTKDLKNYFPPKMLRDMYQEAYKTGYGPPSVIEKKEVNLRRKILSWGLDYEIESQFLNRLVDYNDRFHLPITTDNWNYLPNDEKEKLIKSFTDPKHPILKNTVSVHITIRNEADIKAVILKYAGNRDPDFIRDYLKIILSQSENGSVTFPLENILSPFIKDKINTYDPSGGPNCFNSGLCVNQGPDYKVEFTEASELMAIIDEDYSELNIMEQPQTGDILLYSNSEGHQKHVATYIDDEVVFTKNGINKFNPYIFQKLEDMENIYFREERLSLRVFRHTPIVKLPPESSCNSLMVKMLISM
jgi:hypothetical protein